MDQETAGHRRASGESEQRRASKADQVYGEIKEAILSGALEPGAAIDKLALCDKLGMSRFPVTTAINRLAYERLVVIEPQHGSFVAKIAAKDVREWMLIRRALEIEIAAEAARQPEGLVEELRRNLRYQQAAVDAADIAGFYELDVEFHQLIVQAQGLHHAAEILESLRAHLERVRRLILSPQGRLPFTLAEHKAIVDALEARAPEAARAAMNAHLSKTSELFDSIVAQKPGMFSN